MSGVPQIARILRLELSVADVARSVAFYRDGLGFEVLAVGDAMVRLGLGGRELGLRQVEGGQLGPAPAQANAPAFQHFAVVVRDMAAAYAHVAPLAGAPFSRGGPQHLPPRNGGVRAWKFRDPDGRPVELLELRTGAWREAADAAPQRLFLGIDHTALACANLEASLAFYTARGFHQGEASHNYGPAQDALDGLDGVDLRIATLHTPEPGPHIELLHYRTPPPPARTPADGDDRFVTTALEASTGAAAPERDPDGHRLAIVGW
ncbi:MAG: VOC family protein [Caulobacteraceae bacterium]|nr:VOC family protein [Caulobacter sp.]